MNNAHVTILRQQTQIPLTKFYQHLEPLDILYAIGATQAHATHIEETYDLDYDSIEGPDFVWDDQPGPLTSVLQSRERATCNLTYTKQHRL